MKLEIELNITGLEQLFADLASLRALTMDTPEGKAPRGRKPKKQPEPESLPVPAPVAAAPFVVEEAPNSAEQDAADEAAETEVSAPSGFTSDDLRAVLLTCKEQFGKAWVVSRWDGVFKTVLGPRQDGRAWGFSDAGTWSPGHIGLLIGAWQREAAVAGQSAAVAGDSSDELFR